jgi:predicted metal-binding membrane protein
MDASSPLETALRHDRIVITLALAGTVAVAWAYMAHEARAMDATGVCECGGMAMSGPDIRPWSPAAILPLFLMWAEMMVAMMLPSAAPTLLTFARVNRERRKQQRPFIPTGLFLLGYLLVWTAFSGVIAFAQWGLHGAALLSPKMESSSSVLSGLLLIFTGIFQWTPLKRACLRHCRSPLSFLMQDWREGQWGAIAMGLQHGAYCTGCCWLLMVLLFVAGVMNLTWVAIITVLVVVEKMVPGGFQLGTAVGLIFAAWGVWVLVAR